MKRIIAMTMIAVLLLGSFSYCFGADDQVRYGYRVKDYVRYDTTNTVSEIRARLTVPNYIGTINVTLDTTEGKGDFDVLVVYLPNNKWDNGSYYSAVSGTISSSSAKIYSCSDELVLWSDLYNYGFLPTSGGIYTADYNSLQMHFLSGPGLYTALASIYYSKSDLGCTTLEQMKSKAPSSLLLTAAGYPFILALDDTTINFFLSNGRLNKYSNFGWPGLADLLLSARYEKPSVAAEKALNNFTVKNNYYRGVFLDVGLEKTSWYDSSVATVYELGLMEGSGGKFNPDANITLAQAIAMAARLHNIYYGDSGKFTEGPVWYSTYVNYAIKNNIIKSGDFDAASKGNAAYTRSATRAEMAYIFSNAMPADALPKINKISRIPDVTRYSKYGNSIYKLYEAGILEGSADHSFSPDRKITRAEAASIMAKMAVSSQRSEFTIK